MRNVVSCLAVVLAAGCTTAEPPGAESSPPNAPELEPGEEPVASYLVTTSFDNSYGRDSKLVEAVRPLLDLEHSADLIVGGLMANAAPGYETQIVDALTDIYATTPYLLGDAVYEIRRLLEADENFRLQQWIRITEQDGKQYLRVSTAGFMFWNQTITETGNFSWADVVYMKSEIAGERMPYTANGATVTIPSHTLELDLGTAALTFLESTLLPLIGDPCYAANRVAQQVPGTNANAMMAACETGIDVLEERVRSNLQALGTKFQFEMQGVGTVAGDELTGTWSGTVETPMAPRTALVNAMFK